MTIEELMYYGRYYDFEYEGHHLWWFDLNSETVHQFDELIKKFGYLSQDDIISSGLFIPLFETNIVNLEQEFLKLNNYNIKQFELLDYPDFDTCFKVFVEKNNLLESWRKFENQRLYDDMMIWGKENGILNKIVKK